MRDNLLSALFILAFLKSGRSNSSVFISHGRDGDGYSISCVLAGEENITQVNWEMAQGPNRTKLGMFHPKYGIHVGNQNNIHVKIQANVSPRPSSSLLMQTAINQSVLICCAFITFPSGKLEQCTDPSKKDIDDAAVMNDFAYMDKDPGLGIFGQLGAIILGSILSTLLLMVLYYTCSVNCFRRKSYTIRQEHAESTVKRSEDGPTGFDPSKLYAKLKQDLLYGRLWKSYQGQSKAPMPGTTSGQAPVYSMLGQSEPETLTTATD